MLAGLTVYTYNQRTIFTLDSGLSRAESSSCERSSTNCGKVLLLPSEGGREREGVRTGEFLVGPGLLVTFINFVLFSRLIEEYREVVNRRQINRENRENKKQNTNKRIQENKTQTQRIK